MFWVANVLMSRWRRGGDRRCETVAAGTSWSSFVVVWGSLGALKSGYVSAFDGGVCHELLVEASIGSVNCAVVLLVIKGK